MCLRKYHRARTSSARSRSPVCNTVQHRAMAIESSRQRRTANMGGGRKTKVQTSQSCFYCSVATMNYINLLELRAAEIIKYHSYFYFRSLCKMKTNFNIIFCNICLQLYFQPSQYEITQTFRITFQERRPGRHERLIRRMGGGMTRESTRRD